MRPGELDGGSHGPLSPPWRTLGEARRWEELLLPEPSLALLQTIGRRVRESSAGELRDPEQRAVMALFCGEPGTGKTLAAQILATELAVPLIQVDCLAAAAPGPAALAAAIWRVLREGERQGAAIVFDDAGPLLSGSSARRGLAPDEPGPDLAGRCASYPGLIVFCSKVALRMAPAQEERLAAVVRFPFPEGAPREQLWRQALPADAQLGEGDLTAIAHAFRLSGGAIATCAAAAAELARDAGHSLSTSELTDALEAHYSGVLLSDSTRGALAALRARAQAQAPPAPEPAPVAAEDSGGGDERHRSRLPWRR